jgi:protein Mpv17
LMLKLFCTIYIHVDNIQRIESTISSTDSFLSLLCADESIYPSTMTPPARAVSSARGLAARLWARYSLALREKPLRTRMVSSGVLYFIGDHVAQYGIEDRKWAGDDEDESFDVSALGAQEERGVWRVLHVRKLRASWPLGSASAPAPTRAMRLSGSRLGFRARSVGDAQRSFLRGHS